MILPITLTSAAAAALLALWLGVRIGRLRIGDKVLHGDGGHPLLAKRIRAQLNFVEYTPFVLLLIAAIEISGRGGGWLRWVPVLYFAARIAHMFGMDADKQTRLRGGGFLVTALTLLGLGAYAALIAAGLA